MDIQTNTNSRKRYALYQCCPVAGDTNRVNTADHTPAGREALLEQADQMYPRGIVVTEAAQ